MSHSAPARARAVVGVVIVHHGDSAPLSRCLASLAADPSEVGRRVVVVDNSAADTPLADRLEVPGGLPVEVLPAPDNPGFGAGAGRGVRALAGADDDFRPACWIVLNPDVEVAPGFLAAAVEAIRRPGVGAAAGPIRLGTAQRTLWYAGGDTWPVTGTVTQSRSEADARCEREVGFLPGAALAVAPEAWSGVGGFDERFFLYHEDLDLCLRLRRAGWRLYFAPGMETVHELGAATGSDRRAPFYLEHMARTRFLPWRSLPHRFWLAAIHTPLVLARMAAYGLRGAEGRERARALGRGHAAALGTLWRG